MKKREENCLQLKFIQWTIFWLLISSYFLHALLINLKKNKISRGL